MGYSEDWYIIGADLNGRRCRTARVMLPPGLSPREALHAVRQITRDGPCGPFRPYAVATEVERKIT